MIRNVRDINWDYVGDSVPAFLTLIVIPLTYNIAYGVIAGIISYVLINGIAWLIRKISGDRFPPPNYDAAEPWVIPPGSIVPGWMRFIAGRTGMYKEHEEVNMEMHLQPPRSSLETSSVEQAKEVPEGHATPVYEKSE
ncbi:hypothetical protein NM688_g9356 [Phlebia brevispora]|uniref:Uncharacterized protein n=1 Tax=Phlebia brevispora TaxID=194682 RepID=A0ACC1RJ77_9APHY|nr:hypothetical protein NM688_g9356 [Phlebia brevispora]